ncbi:MAG: rRNA maturation RNase YbeY [Syntrophomonadaceae bacterium]|jgi:probable rRNA maturation factor
MDIMVINQQNKVVYSKELQKIINEAIKTVARLHKLPSNSEVSVLIVDNSYIQEMNLIYRNCNQPTDVLSFAMNEMVDEEPDIDFPSEVNVLGDIVLSLEQAEIQSQEYGHSLEREVGFLICHGMLHLLGYDHENDEETRVMRMMEDKVMAILGLER